VETGMLREVIERAGSAVRLISVGGISSTADVVDRLQAGAHHVQIATAAMLNPRIAVQIREELGRRASMPAAAIAHH
jgi:dihydroorotate dehydrogenase